MLLGTAAAGWERPPRLADGSQASALPEWLAGAEQTIAAANGVEVLGMVELAGGDDRRSAAVTPTTVAAPSVPVVVVMGDSTATQLAAGLRAHGDETEAIAVIDRTDSGCSALIDSAAPWRMYRLSYGYLGEFAFEEPCRTDIDPDDVRPDVIVIVDHGSVFADHLREDGTWASVLDDDLIGDLRSIYLARISEARAIGATLVFTTAPTMTDHAGLLGSMSDIDRLTVYNQFVRDLVGSQADVSLIDLGRVFDQPGAEQRYPRDDGLHVELDGAERLAADVLAPALIDIASRG